MLFSLGYRYCLDLKLERKTTFFCKFFQFMLFSEPSIILNLKLKPKTTFPCKFFQLVFFEPNVLDLKLEDKQHFSVILPVYVVFCGLPVLSGPEVGTKNNIFLLIILDYALFFSELEVVTRNNIFL